MLDAPVHADPLPQQPMMNIFQGTGGVVPLNSQFSSSSANAPSHGPTIIFLKHWEASGLEVSGTFCREKSFFSDAMTYIKVTFKSHKEQTLTSIKISPQSNLTEIMGFNDIASLGAHGSATAQIHLNFQAKTTPVKMELRHSQGHYKFSVLPPLGELVRPSSVVVDFSSFEKSKKQLGGMHEHKTTLDASTVESMPIQKIHKVANVARISSPEEGDHRTLPMYFAGEMVESSKAILLVTLQPKITDSGAMFELKVNCGNAMSGASFLDFFKKALKAV